MTTKIKKMMMMKVRMKLMMKMGMGKKTARKRLLNQDMNSKMQ